MKEAFADPIAAHGWETGKSLQFGPRGTRPRAIASWRGIHRLAPWLTEAMKAADRAEPAESSAAEWLLDNGYQVQRAMLLVEKDMPAGFYARLRPLTSGSAEGEPRILFLAHDLLCATHFQLSRENVLAYLEGYQSNHALDIAELWALPAMLRIACFERLVEGFSLIFRSPAAPFEVSRSCCELLSQNEAEDCVGRAIANLGVVSNINWKEVFSESSQVDRALARDPAATYSRMDFETRDACRQAVECLADLGTSDEVDIVEAALSLAGENARLPFSHVGYWLIAEGKVDLEKRLNIRQSFSHLVGRWLMRRPGSVYAGALFLSGLAGLILPLAYLWFAGADRTQYVVGTILAALPATVLSVTVVNWLITLTVPPCRLPKLDFSQAIDSDWAPIIIMPVIIGDVAEVGTLLARLEAHRLANPGGHGYVLLSDPVDAPEERLPEDEQIERTLLDGIANLNRQHGEGFCLMHRRRRYNATQGCWMAWERKRGKIEEFNSFLLTGNSAPFPVTAGEIDRLQGARLVVTADADTRLPPVSVARLAGTLAHPLNQPIFDDDGRVARGYTVLQPRVEIAPHGSDTLFARLFGGDTAIDIYSRAVSDVYQDLTGTGNYVGKGIYDVAAFSRSLAGRIPENQLLSHDMWEGLHGRAGLVSDIIVYESFPESYAEYVRRWHRWVRGDWQLLPWLFARVPGPEGTWLPNRLTLFDRLRIWDNLRRSLVPASVLLLLLGGWFYLPGSHAFWTIMALLVPSAWLFTDLVTGVARGRRRGVIIGVLRKTADHVQRWVLQIVFLLSDTVVALHAIGITLFRLRRGTKLLEWTSAAHVSGLLSRTRPRSSQWGATWVSPLLALGVLPLLVVESHALLAAAPLILVWLAAPEIAWWTARPRLRTIDPLGTADQRYLRLVARKSWLYFERFAGPEDHWIPPDNHQEAPEPATAHRTSPTNIGMMALSALAAWRLGHIGTPEFVGRMRAMLDTLDRLEKWHGHILNWYDTRDLKPLQPRYVSTVDSGNLAVSLVVLANGCHTIAAAPLFDDRRWSGLEDCLDLLSGAVRGCGLDGTLLRHIDKFEDTIRGRTDDPSTWPALASKAIHEIGLVRNELVDDLTRSEEVEPHLLQGVHDWLERCEHHLSDCRKELAPASDAGPEGVAEEVERIAQRAQRIAEEMNFRPLYDPHRKLFHIGYDVTDQRIDAHYYDLLASEARLASYFAIAKQDVPPEHWFQLGRPIIKQRGQLSLVSWNGSMFEYLMPSLFLRSDPSTLLGETEAAAVTIQKQYCARLHVPWGISESGYASYGTDGIWRYRAFGVPMLGLRRGLEDDLVISPYASALALVAKPREAVANLRQLESRGALGRFGFHEALDFSPGRSPGGREPVPVSSYMAHHQGMTIAAIVNALDDDVLVDWFHADPRMDTVDLLLNERIPWELPTELERIESTPLEPGARVVQPRPQPWEYTDIPSASPLLLGNGRLCLHVASDGCGDLFWKGNVVTCPSGSNRDKGQFLYLRERTNGHLWSPTPVPCRGAEDRRLIVHPHKLEFRCRQNAISTSLDILISPSEEVEIRRMRLFNETAEERVIDFASHADVALAEAAEWSRHPAFARLFVKGEVHQAIDTLLLTKRSRDANRPGLAMAQRLVGTSGSVRIVGRELSRRTTRGRLGNIADFPSVSQEQTEAGTYPLDSAAAFVGVATLPPHGEVEIALVTAVAADASEALELARRYGSLASLDWAEQDAADRVRYEIMGVGLAPDRLREAERLFSALFAPAIPRQHSPDVNLRDDLWALGVSGDFAILLVELEEEFDTKFVKFVLGAYRLWRWRGALVDIVLLHPGLPGYVEPLRQRIFDVLRECDCDEHIGERGGIMIVGSEHNEPQRIEALRRAATVTLSDGEKSIAHVLRESEFARIPVPLFIPTAARRGPHTAAAGFKGANDLSLANGLGGFTAEDEYRINLSAGEQTPAPWANVLANPEFGTIVTESGLGFTFAGNSGENRVTPWLNDPLFDPQVEALYLRDEETGQVWSVTPLPAGDESECRVEHSLGETRWQRRSMDLEQEMRCFVAADTPLKVVSLRLRNSGTSPRRVTATYFADWLLGANADDPAPFRTSRFSPDLAAIIGRNGWQREFAEKVAFLATNRAVHSLTTSRLDFFGNSPDWRHPAGLSAWGLGERSGNEGADAVAALQIHFDISPGESIEGAFLIGEADSETEANDIIARWRTPQAIETGRQILGECWTNRCGSFKVDTPDPRFDVMVNRWLPYQAISSRLFARAGYYQASGAFGFRDQLQDVLALVLSSPELARDQILRAASFQFEEGDVLHWWHPPTGRGVRTRCSDDLLWLPFAASRYVAATGDTAILDEKVSFLAAPELAPDEHDRFGEFPSGSEASLYEHCRRAFDRAFRLGSNGLPLMGDGDWNDGMNRVGARGKGESLWLAWFLAVTIEDFARICEKTGHTDFGPVWLPRRHQLIASAEQHGWDGAWYVRAFDDHGRPWGSHTNDECRIDALAQAWAVMAGAEKDRTRQALDSAIKHLVVAGDDIARLLTPPFEHTPRDPGYIKAYPAGIRENGGQYTHGAAWLGIACAMLRDGDRAKTIFDRLNPLCHADTLDHLATYLTEPYAIAADIAAGEHLGRGGWSWYTGAAAWTWRLATEYILGIRLEYGRISLDPCLPPDWPGFSAQVRREGILEFTVTRGVAERCTLDGLPADRSAIPFPGTGKTAKVELIIRDESLPGENRATVSELHT